MKRMTASRFKDRCLKVLDEVSSTGEPVVITKHGQPVAKLVAPDAKTDDVFGCLRGQIEIVGDITEPAVPLEDWEVLR